MLIYTRLSQLLSCHSGCQLAVVPFNHSRTITHLLASRVYVSFVVEQFQRCVGMTQLVMGPDLPFE